MKLDRLGRPYRVDKRDGRRIVKTTRPKDFTPEEWKSLGHERCKALAEEFKTAGIGTSDDEDEKEKKEHEDDKKNKKKKKKGKPTEHDDKDADEILDDKPDDPSDKIAVPRSMTSELRSVDAVLVGSSDGVETISHPTIDENNNWVEWEEFVSSVSPASASVVIQHEASSSEDTTSKHRHGIPSMPCAHHMKDDHRM